MEPFSAAVTDIDTTGIHAFEELFKSLKKREVEVNIIKHANIYAES